MAGSWHLSVESFSRNFLDWKEPFPKAAAPTAGPGGTKSPSSRPQFGTSPHGHPSFTADWVTAQLLPLPISLPRVDPRTLLSTPPSSKSVSAALSQKMNLLRFRSPSATYWLDNSPGAPAPSVSSPRFPYLSNGNNVPASWSCHKG